jgi:hypothetical protein
MDNTDKVALKGPRGKLKNVLGESGEVSVGLQPERLAICRVFL